MDTKESRYVTVARIAYHLAQPDYSTLSRTYRRLLRSKVLDQMRRQLLGKVGVQEEVIVSDSTGYATTQASAYCSRTGRLMHEFQKGVYAAGAQSQFILAWRQGRGPGNDSVFLKGLRREARRTARRGRWVMVADAGLDGQGVTERDLIPPIRRGGNLQAQPEQAQPEVGHERIARAELVAAARLDGLFGQC